MVLDVRRAGERQEDPAIAWACLQANIQQVKHTSNAGNVNTVMNPFDSPLAFDVRSVEPHWSSAEKKTLGTTCRKKRIDMLWCKKART
jgi:hypothetical protein